MLMIVVSLRVSKRKIEFCGTRIVETVLAMLAK